MSEHHATGTLVPFNYGDAQVRVIQVDGEPWWVAADIARILGYRDAHNMCRRLDDEDRGTHSVSTPSGEQFATVINEPGLYAAVLGSQIPGAVDFKRWVTREVLPSIRKHGGYLTATKVEEVLSDPDTIIRLATDLKTERSRRAELEALREVDAPKVLFADAVSASKSNILVGELAKILKGNGIDIGANRLFELLRSRGYLIARKGTDWNMPTQKSMELGLFRIKETTVVHSDGHTSLNKTPKVTGKGQQYFIERFLDGRLAAEAARPRGRPRKAKIEPDLSEVIRETLDRLDRDQAKRADRLIAETSKGKLSRSESEDRLSTVVWIDKELRKLWRDVNDQDLRAMDHHMFMDAPANQDAYRQWRKHFEVVLAAVSSHGTVGRAVAAGAFPPPSEDQQQLIEVAS